MDALNEAYVGILLATVLIALGYLTGTRRRLTFELVEGRRREQEERAPRWRNRRGSRGSSTTWSPTTCR